jgi:ABC-type proline/glycine betaine transport system ATPase subunit
LYLFLWYIFVVVHRIVVMDAGQVSEYGSPAELLSNPRSQFAQLVAAERQQQQQQQHIGAQGNSSDAEDDPTPGASANERNVSDIDSSIKNNGTSQAVSGVPPVTSLSGMMPAKVL